MTGRTVKLLMFVLLVTGLCPGLASAGFRYYRASLTEARWLVTGDRLMCELKQVVPGFGEFRFQRRATYAMQFVVDVEFPRYAAGIGHLYMKVPEWKNYVSGRVLGKIPLQPGREIISLPEDWSRLIATGLNDGMYAEIAYADSAEENRDWVAASAVPFEFNQVWEEFSRCQQNMLDYRFEDVKQAVFYYPKGSKSLKKKEKEFLDKMAELALLEPEFSHFEISSYTDSRGNRNINQQVSEQRAEMIRDYLVAKGVAKDRFTISASGEKNPKYNNRTEKGREMNRRVEISMVLN